jgi:hypothetical protein
MRRLGITLGAALLGCISLYLIAALWLNLGEEHAKAIAGIPLLLSTQIFEVIDRNGLRNELASRKQERAISFQNFGVRPFGAIALALITTLALFEIIGDYMAIYFDVAKFGDAFTWDYVPGDSSDNFLIVGAATIIPGLFGMYLIGRWLGKRSKAGAIASVGSVAIAILIEKCSLGFFLYGGVIVFVPGEEPPSLLFILSSMVAGTLLFAAVAALGFWRGRRHRLAAYLQFLLSAIPDSERVALLSLAEEEVFKMAPAPAPGLDTSARYAGL